MPKRKLLNTDKKEIIIELVKSINAGGRNLTAD